MEVKIACTGSGMMPLNQIIPLQGGLKDLSDANYRKLKNQILTHGMVSPFMIWEGRCIDGHQRLRTLLKMKEEGILMPESFPKVDIEAPDIKSAKRILLAISSQYGKLTGDGLYEYMQDMEIDIPEMKESFEFDSLDFGDFEREYFDENPGTIEGEEEVPADAPTISKLGDIWHLGNHKIMCGDCTIEDNLKLLMADEKADMVFTDPPYGVSVKNTQGSIMGDEDLEVFIKSLPILKEASKKDSHFYIWCASGDMYPRSIYEFSKVFEFQNTLPIRCTHENKRGKKSAFKLNFETCLFANDNSKPFNSSDKFKVSETTLNDSRYEGDGYLKVYPALMDSMRATEHNLNMVHPTQKKVSMIEFYLEISSNKADKILDAFLGSGSTLIACEKTNRKCYACEIDPHYVDVAVKRFADFTHQSDNIYLERDGEKIPYSTLVDLNPIL